MLGRERIYGAAYQCLLKQKWRRLPIDPFQFHLECDVISYQEYAAIADVPIEKINCTSKLVDGYAIVGLRSRPLLLYNELIPPPRQRFTFAHELGHLLLSHKGDSPQREELEADLFASVLLMPDPVLSAFRRRGKRITEHFLMNTFDVSRSAARMKLSRQMTPPLPHPLDMEVESLFYSILSQ